MIDLYMKISAVVYCLGLIVYIYNSNGIRKRTLLRRYAITNLVASILWPITVPIAIKIAFFNKHKVSK